MVSPAALGPGREFDQIRRTLAGAPPLPDDVVVGPGDDAAVLAPDVVVSTDLAVEGVHFRLDWISAREAGIRAVGAAVSDLAAMGGELIGVLASVATPPPGDLGEELMGGVRSRTEELGGHLLGGDLTRSPGPLLVDVVVLGRAPRPLLRSGARAGDELWVTGFLGAAAGAVACWQAGDPLPPGLRQAFVRPEPRLQEVRWLTSRVRVTAAIDLSDGLAGDAGHLSAASAVALRLQAGALPLASDLPGGDTLELALHGGEDYEVLLAVAPGTLSRELVDEFARRFQLPLTRIGDVETGSGVSLVPTGGGPPEALARGGFDHLAVPEAGDP